ncbi:MAG: hypothetical protein EOO27_06200 [Comamonadaceae bacterium]|nr:MAG: hypothetical protein EOO27_06200 [Comamonadaceae bacterium]
MGRHQRRDETDDDAHLVYGPTIQNSNSAWCTAAKAAGLNAPIYTDGLFEGKWVPGCTNTLSTTYTKSSAVNANDTTLGYVTVPGEGASYLDRTVVAYSKDGQITSIVESDGAHNNPDYAVKASSLNSNRQLTVIDIEKDDGSKYQDLKTYDVSGHLSSDSATITSSDRRSIVFNIDSNGDGKIDSSSIKVIEHNGNYIYNQDRNNDGRLDIGQAFDASGRKTYEANFTYNPDGSYSCNYDVDADGRLDVGRTYNAIGQKTYEANFEYRNGGAYSVAYDVNGDGRIDVDRDLNANGQKTSEISFVYNIDGTYSQRCDNNGDGRLDELQTFKASGALSSDIDYFYSTDGGQTVNTDFNGDGRLDLGQAFNALGQKTYQADFTYLAGGYSVNYDTNGDGKLDVAKNFDVFGKKVYEADFNYQVSSGYSVNFDTDGDSRIDVVRSFSALGIETYEASYAYGSNNSCYVSYDYNGDGFFDSRSNFLPATPQFEQAARLPQAGSYFDDFDYDDLRFEDTFAPVDFIGVDW